MRECEEQTRKKKRFEGVYLGAFECHVLRDPKARASFIVRHPGCGLTSPAPEFPISLLPFLPSPYLQRLLRPPNASPSLSRGRFQEWLHWLGPPRQRPVLLMPRLFARSK